jgi:hypothetical protein
VVGGKSCFLKISLYCLKRYLLYCISYPDYGMKDWDGYGKLKSRRCHDFHVGKQRLQEELTAVQL